MQKLKGWTTKPFVGCDKCKEEGRIVCQATRYRLYRKAGEWTTTYYCNYHEDLADPLEKRLGRQKKKEIERAKEAIRGDDRDSDWYYVSGAHNYI